MKSYEVVVIGAGPAGLTASIEASKAGAEVLLVDENERPGGQLFKQIHKFFGSREHKAGTRGFEIGQELLDQTKDLGIEVILGGTVLGLYPGRKLTILKGETTKHLQAQRIILAPGATEKPLSFPGWTLPGVMGAGAAQTMINVHRVLPGEDIVMVGSGNVGLIVTYQLLQAGANVKGIVEALPEIGGYGVHSAKVRRAGVPIYTTHTISRGFGDDQLECVEMIEINENFQPISGTEKRFNVDTLCVAVGLSPLGDLAQMINCEMTSIAGLGNQIPVHDRNMKTSVDGVYVAGDVTGIEEASSAMEEGHLAGVAVAESLEYLSEESAREKKEETWGRLNDLREGPFGRDRRDGKEEIMRGASWGDKDV